MKGSGQPRRFKSPRGHPVTVYTMIVANGTLGSLYIETYQKLPENILQQLPTDCYIEYTKNKEGN